MNVKLIASKALFKAKQARPTLALIGGIGLGIGAIVVACKATPKVDKLLDESRKQIQNIHTIADDPNSGFTEEEKQHAILLTWGNTIFGLVKHYGPAAAMEAGSIALLVFSHCEMKQRVVGLGAAVLALTDSLNRAKENCTERFGEEKTNDIFYGLDTQKVEEIVLDEETGKEKKVKTPVKVVEPEHIVSPYAVIFDENNPNYIKSDPLHNADFISDSEIWLKRKRNTQGYLFLNDARIGLGFKPIPAGQVMGWTLNDPIDLGVEHIRDQAVYDFRIGKEKAYIIDFQNLKPIIDEITELDIQNHTL